MRNDGTIWGGVELSEGETRHWQVRRRLLWLRREKNRWLYATDLNGRRTVEALVSGARKPDELPWNSIVGLRPETTRLMPALPDQPVLLKSSDPVQILPGGRLRLLLAVPLWIQLSGGVSVFDLETDPLSRTWFGDTLTGEAAYALEIQDWMVRREMQTGGGHIQVPLQIANDSQELLSFQRLLVRVVHLSVYGAGELLFTNDVGVTFRSVNQYSQISFSSSSSLDPGGSVLLQDPRQRVSENLIRRSFLFFRNLTE